MRWRRTYGYGLSLAVAAGGLAVPAMAQAAPIGPAPSIATQVSATAIGTGGTLTDTATLRGFLGIVTGTVQFYSCKVASLTTGCAKTDTTRTAIGSPVTLSGGSATSAPFGSTLSTGTYCVGVQYTAARGSFYSDAYSGSHHNECFTVEALAEPAVTTQLTSTGPVTGPVPVGATVTDAATISTTATSFTGTVMYRLYSTLEDCQADTDAWPLTPSHGTAEGSVTVGTNPQGSSSPVTFPDPGTFYWAAFYSGDVKNAPATSDCTTEELTVGTEPTLTTKLSAPQVIVGTSVTDSATLSGATGGAGGTVAYRYYPSLAACQADTDSFPETPPSGGTAAGTATVTAGVVQGPSTPVPFSVPGTYYWAAFYSGDSQNGPAASDCTTEVLNVQATPAIRTRLSATRILTGQSVTDSAILAGATTDAGGTVSYRYYPTLTACLADTASFPGTPPAGGKDAGTVIVTGGIVPDSKSVPVKAAGIYFWAAFYSGDPHNAATASSCRTEVLFVSEHPKIVTKVFRVNGVYFVDNAKLIGTGGPVTGTVTFFLCAQVGLFTGCPPNLGAPISGPKRLVLGAATSGQVPLKLAPGKYCVGVRYHNDGRSPYLDTDYSSPVNECFTLLP